jgi:hypothetical protein
MRKGCGPMKKPRFGNCHDNTLGKGMEEVQNFRR